MTDTTNNWIFRCYDQQCKVVNRRSILHECEVMLNGSNAQGTLAEDRKFTLQLRK